MLLIIFGLIVGVVATVFGVYLFYEWNNTSIETSYPVIEGALYWGMFFSGFGVLSIILGIKALKTESTKSND